MLRPLFIAFEGIDGSGTTTQANLLARWVGGRGIPLVCTREPGGTPLAESIRRLLLDRQWTEMEELAELFLYAASRAQHVRQVIQPALAAGTPVICDRFADSTLAYQGYGRGLDLDVVRTVNAVAVGGCVPDVTVLLDLPVHDALARRSRRGAAEDRLEAAGAALQERVRAGYREIAGQRPSSYLVMDARLGQEELALEIERQLSQRWPRFPHTT